MLTLMTATTRIDCDIKSKVQITKLLASAAVQYTNINIDTDNMHTLAKCLTVQLMELDHLVQVNLSCCHMEDNRNIGNCHLLYNHLCTKVVAQQSKNIFQWL